MSKFIIWISREESIVPRRTNAARSGPSRNAPSAAKTLSMKQMLLIVVPIVVVLVGAVVFLLLTRFGNGKDVKVQGPQDTRATVVSQANAQEVKTEIDKPVQDGSYQITMNLKWVFNGKSSDAYVENSKDNTRTVYIEVFRSDTNELIYSSPYIPVGEKLKGFTLTKTPPVGKYKCLVTYHLVDDDHKELSNLSVSVNIEVK
jgi:hypothetical protein